MKNLFEYLMQNGAIEFEDGKNIFLKEVARTGVFTSRQGKRVSLTKEFFEELIKNFVPGKSPIPLGHDGMKDASKNTGWVQKLFMKDNSLWAEMEITEPDIADKIRRGTIKADSIGVIMGNVGKVLEHIALTLSPAVPGLSDFKTALENAGAECYEFETADETDINEKILELRLDSLLERAKKL